MLADASLRPAAGHEATEAFLAALAAPPSAADQEFLLAVLADYRPEELRGVSPADVGRLAAGLLRRAREDGDADPFVRISPATTAGGLPLEADLLEVIQPDAPFLVDSIMSALVDAGVDVLAMFHPIVTTELGRRSAIQVWLAPVGDERRSGLEAALRGVLGDVRLAVDDFEPMLGLLRRAITDLMAEAPRRDPAALAEALAFLRWVEEGHFVFLGARIYEYPRTSDGGYAAEEPCYQPEASFGVLCDPARRVLRRGSEPAILSQRLRESLADAPPLTVAKANLRSQVHRRVYMDYIGVRRYGEDGRAAGEVRFVGLFTAQAYDEPVRNVPLIRRKVERVMTQAGQALGGHNEMRLANILETYPRDELFQISEGELLEIALGVLHLSDRPRVKLFVRRDPLDRFISVLFYAPRDRYDARLQERVGQMLAQAFGGHVSAYYPSYSDAPLARVHYIIGVNPGEHPEPDLLALEPAINKAARTFEDEFEAVVRRSASPEQVGAILAAWHDAFPPGYRDTNEAAEAWADVGAIAPLGPEASIAVRVFRDPVDPPTRLRLKLYREGAPIPLADALPILDGMGLNAVSEEGFALAPRDKTGEKRTVWAHEFALDGAGRRPFTLEAAKPVIEEAYLAVWNDQAECDGFNRLVLDLNVSWRWAALIRALARYRQQSGLDPSPAVQQQALSDYADVTSLILELFQARFDPQAPVGVHEREARSREILGRIEEALQSVESLDADRALRRLAALVSAIKRTNFYLTDETGRSPAYISFKVASRELADLPHPKPFAEIFVASPAVEAAHLRLGPVARGGLRWSDRRDDFRTEVLGLVKAQQVKNAVIVPVGAKGGFFPKRVSKASGPEASQAEAIAAYKTFLHGMLDLTDTIDGGGEVVHPAGIVILDGHDPYLVVAADKGTASFSDIANGEAEAYDFWLGDAFASGGSAGYDHKAMGITARGAWESVKRHFRELGKPIETQSFTAVGVGDMSGDVFGNGMLLSKTMKLVAAFDHRHIFIDPDPDPAVSWTERKRLFDKPRSSWDDYDRALLSAGGAVIPRSAKSVSLSPEAKTLLDIKTAELIPAEVIRAILKARADLLYLGGIGGYVKASTQSNADVGDKANDAIRIDGADLRCKVVGEGANLGFTQAGRIEYAAKGGRINTDAIDNSAGVDTSDHEVNIKILTGMAERAGKLDRTRRNALLVEMTDEVAVHVLAHNRDQTLALSLLQAEAPAALEAHAKFMDQLEAKGRLDRALEGLPDAAGVAARAQEGRGLTRPELAVLLAYGKLDLTDALVASAAPDDPYFRQTLKAYFPRALEPFEDEMRRHRLRREIIATVIGNEMINLCGPTFPPRIMASAGCGVAELAISFEAARRVLGFDEIWGRVATLDGEAPAAGQIALFQELVRVLRGQTFWLARIAAKAATSVQALVEAYAGPAQEMRSLFPEILSSFEGRAAVRRAAGWVKLGVEKDLAHAIALYRPLTLTVVLADLARDMGWPIPAAARLYHAIGGAFGFDRLRAAAGSRQDGDAYERLAVRRLVEDLQTEQAALTRRIMGESGGPQAADSAEHVKATIASWRALNSEAAKTALDTLANIERDGGGWTFAKLTIANAALKALA